MHIKNLCFLFLFGYACSAYSQSQTKYSESVEEKIKQVENHISGWVQIEGVKSVWTLRERMQYYHVNGLSIAVIHNYKLDGLRVMDGLILQNEFLLQRKHFFRLHQLVNQLTLLAY